jgi:hypothetical protein
MTRTPPPSDWVAYVVVISTVVLMMIGKYLIAKVENIVEDVIHDVENKIK